MSDDFNIKPGDRVGATYQGNGQDLHLLGFGVYEGDFEHPEYGFDNPRIKLDTGNIVWGIECWWGPEQEIKQLVAAADTVLMCELVRDQNGTATSIKFLVTEPDPPSYGNS